jgi:hypothetical protein
MTDDAGRYRFAKLAPDRYLVAAVESGAQGTSQRAVAVTVAASGARADLRLPAGRGHVVVRGRGAAAEANAQVYLLSGAVNATTAGELEVAVAQRGDGSTETRILRRGEEAHFAAVEPGAYSLCAVLVLGDLNDPAERQRAQRTAALLPVACHGVTVPEGAGLVAVDLPWPSGATAAR